MEESERQKSKAVDTSKRELRLQADVGKFVQQYARKRQKGHDPNDRQYDRKMDAQTLASLLNDTDDNQ